MANQQEKKKAAAAGRNRVKCARYRAENRLEKAQLRRRLRHALSQPNDIANLRLVLATPITMMTKAQRVEIERIREQSKFKIA